MSSFSLKSIDLNRLQKYYPLSNPRASRSLVSDTPFELSYMMISLESSDTVTFTFEKSFSGIPNVVAGFVSLDANIGNVSVYVESVNKSGGVIRTSVPTTGKISLQAIYIPG